MYVSIDLLSDSVYFVFPVSFLSLFIWISFLPPSPSPLVYFFILFTREGSWRVVVVGRGGRGGCDLTVVFNPLCVLKDVSPLL